MRPCTSIAVVASLCASLGIAWAQDGPQQVHGGSADVTIGGAGAARQGDEATGGGAIVEGSPNVIINGRPAALRGGRTTCGGIVVGGSATVFINGKPLARAGDPATGCPGK